MKLTFILVDQEKAAFEVQAGMPAIARKRAVSIELTEQQIADIGIRFVGKSCGRDCFDDIQEVFYDREEL